MTNFMQNVMMDFKIDGKQLVLDYELLTEKCSWSIFDVGGMEMCKGTLKGKEPHLISVASLKPALYQLCIIDGDKLLNTKFRIG